MNRFLHSAVFTVILFTGACSEPTPDAKDVAEQYWQAILSGQTEEVDTLIGVASDLELSQMIQPGSGSRARFGDTKVEGTNASVSTTIAWVDAEREAKFELQTFLVLIDGLWKIDAEKTQYAFFNSVYQSGLEPSPTDDTVPQQDLGASNAEFKKMMDELGRVNQELQQQSGNDNKAVLDFLRRLDTDSSENER